MTALDTNLLIYSCDKADPDRQARALEIISGTTDAVLLWQVACEFVAASRKLSTQGFTPLHAWDRLREYLALFQLILPIPGCSNARASCISTTAGHSGMP